MRLLLVDDDPVSLRVMRAAVESAGHVTSSAKTGEDALALFNASRPDGIITDHVMPGMDGAELGRRVRHLPDGEGVFLLLVTGLDAETAAGLANGAGFDGYLTKPIDLARLEELLEAGAASLESTRRSARDAAR